jgi:ferredoxin
MTAWYDHNPEDVDPSSVTRYVEECDAFPPEVVDNAEVVDAAIASILASGIPSTDPVRAQAQRTLAAEACDLFDSGTRSPYVVGTDVADQGGSPRDYRAVIAEAVKQCPEHRADLTAFSTPDIVGAGDRLAAFVTSNWPRAVGTFPEWMAAAQFVCAERQGRVDGAATFVEYITGPDEVDEFVSWTQANLC